MTEEMTIIYGSVWKSLLRMVFVCAAPVTFDISNTPILLTGLSGVF